MIIGSHRHLSQKSSQTFSHLARHPRPVLACVAYVRPQEDHVQTMSDGLHNIVCTHQSTAAKIQVSEVIIPDEDYAQPRRKPSIGQVRMIIASLTSFSLLSQQSPGLGSNSPSQETFGFPYLYRHLSVCPSQFRASVMGC